MSARNCAPFRLFHTPSWGFKQERGNLTSSGCFHPVPACWMAPVVPGLLAQVGVLVGSTADPWIMSQSLDLRDICIRNGMYEPGGSSWDNGHHVESSCRYRRPGLAKCPSGRRDNNERYCYRHFASGLGFVLTRQPSRRSLE